MCRRDSALLRLALSHFVATHGWTCNTTGQQRERQQREELGWRRGSAMSSSDDDEDADDEALGLDEDHEAVAANSTTTGAATLAAGASATSDPYRPHLDSGLAIIGVGLRTLIDEGSNTAASGGASSRSGADVDGDDDETGRSRRSRSGKGSGAATLHPLHALLGPDELTAAKHANLIFRAEVRRLIMQGRSGAALALLNGPTSPLPSLNSAPPRGARHASSRRRSSTANATHNPLAAVGSDLPGTARVPGAVVLRLQCQRILDLIRKGDCEVSVV